MCRTDGNIYFCDSYGDLCKPLNRYGNANRTRAIIQTRLYGPFGGYFRGGDFHKKDFNRIKKSDFYNFVFDSAAAAAALRSLSALFKVNAINEI